MEAKGVTIHKSKFGVKETIDKLQSFLQQHGATIYVRINQQAEANKSGLHLLPLEFILFGNPAAGGLLMIDNPLVALDLPLKVIAWEDDKKDVWLAYNKSGYIKDRYSLPDIPNSPLVLDNIIKMALGI
ncbi:DUF302 domain-containing protein [Ferruginibacter paludis]|uniref:DUF302 domain-containing protein n=1 Tax=Ferruginibacter paludis TaxID=1310417 RepID=UPI0025B58DB9|nr:DUF302 domain-containing protein [Ferruginibacter paludis]MDN3656127.1 DUF302 domain-containing protein [Ferruginibacter paludis]